MSGNRVRTCEAVYEAEFSGSGREVPRNRSFAPANQVALVGKMALKFKPCALGWILEFFPQTNPFQQHHIQQPNNRNHGRRYRSQGG